MFNVTEYVNDLEVTENDQELQQIIQAKTLHELICDDAWLARQLHFGVAGAMERQLEYLGGTLLPQAEQRLQRMESEGIMGESYVVNSWFGETNKEDEHTNDEIPHDVQVDNQKGRVEQFRARMRTAGIMFVIYLQSHDEISRDLDQLTYAQIKARAAFNRNQTAAANEKMKARQEKQAATN
mgnify:CR=1 FL=1|jgi:hypothetical protein|tara:strand:+ start:2188 stop:2733 length:546 start_codon:yes stop_codon:yes gene_type:complete